MKRKYTPYISPPYISSRGTIKTSLLSVILIYLLNIFLNSALHFLGPSLYNLPPGCTSRVQVVNVTVNKPFKDEVCRLFEDHLDKHLELYVEGKLSDSQQRILITKWVSQV